jgi:hypothetical protein
MNVANVASPSARDRLVGERTVLINQLRGILLERGIASRRDDANSRNTWQSCWLLAEARP